MRGHDYSPQLLAGEPIEGRRDVFATSAPEFAMLRTREWKYLRYGQGKEVLYDLTDTDRYEVVNRADAPACRETLQQMRERMLTRSINAGRSPLRHMACW
jgi:hypothetical protein